MKGAGKKSKAVFLEGIHFDPLVAGAVFFVNTNDVVIESGAANNGPTTPSKSSSEQKKITVGNTEVTVQKSPAQAAPSKPELPVTPMLRLFLNPMVPKCSMSRVES